MDGGLDAGAGGLVGGLACADLLGPLGLLEFGFQGLVAVCLVFGEVTLAAIGDGALFGKDGFDRLNGSWCLSVAEPVLG